MTPASRATSRSRRPRRPPSVATSSTSPPVATATSMARSRTARSPSRAHGRHDRRHGRLRPDPRPQRQRHDGGGRELPVSRTSCSSRGGALVNGAATDVSPLGPNARVFVDVSQNGGNNKITGAKFQRRREAVRPRLQRDDGRRLHGRLRVRHRVHPQPLRHLDGYRGRLGRGHHRAPPAARTRSTAT